MQITWPGVRGAAAALAMLIGLAATAAVAAASGDPGSTKIAERRYGPCIVTVTRAEGLHVVKITGLDPDENFDLTLTYQGRRLVIPIVVAGKGVVVVGLEPILRGDSTGVGHVDFDSRRCRAHFSYPWHSRV